MTVAIERRLKALETKVAKQSEIIESLEDYLENKWAEEAITNSDPDDEWFPAWLVNDILDGKNRIKTYRKFRGINQAELAEICETSAAYISQLETGNHKAGANMPLRLAKALNVDPEDLVT